MKRRGKGGGKRNVCVEGMERERKKVSARENEREREREREDTHCSTTLQNRIVFGWGKKYNPYRPY